MSYEEKFREFLAAIQHAKLNNADRVLVPSPETLGDTYEELIESLDRLSVADLLLQILPPDERSSSGFSQN